MALPASTHPFFLAALVVAGCATRDPEPLLAPTAGFHRTIAYLDAGTPARVNTVYAPAEVVASAEQTAGYLIVRVGVRDRRGEGIAFRVARAELMPATVGAYGYKTELDRTPPAEITYTVQPPNFVATGSSSWGSYPDWASKPAGTFALTAYDAKRRVLSGRFTVSWSNEQDPLNPVGVYPPRRGDLTLEGTFDNLVIPGVL